MAGAAVFAAGGLSGRNPDAADCAFLVIQGVGRRDFVPLDRR